MTAVNKAKHTGSEQGHRCLFLLDFLMVGSLQRSLTYLVTRVHHQCFSTKVTEASAVQIKGSGLHAGLVCLSCHVCGVTPVWREIRVRKGELRVWLYDLHWSCMRTFNTSVLCLFLLIEGNELIPMMKASIKIALKRKQSFEDKPALVYRQNNKQTGSVQLWK